MLRSFLSRRLAPVYLSTRYRVCTDSHTPHRPHPLTNILASLEFVDILCNLAYTGLGGDQRLVIGVVSGRGLYELVQEKWILEHSLDWFDEQRLGVPGL